MIFIPNQDALSGFHVLPVEIISIKVFVFLELFSNQIRLLQIIKLKKILDSTLI